MITKKKKDTFSSSDTSGDISTTIELKNEGVKAKTKSVQALRVWVEATTSKLTFLSLLSSIVNV